MEPQSNPASHTVSSRYSTNAWLALGVGVALALLFWAGMLLTARSSNIEATIACQAFGLSAIGVCSIWAIVMAIRALLAGEKPASPTILLLLVSALGGIYGASLWLYLPGTNPDWPYLLLLPVVLPLFAFVVWSWVRIARYLVSAQKARSITSGQPEPTLIESRRSLIKGGVKYGIVCALVLAPLPLLVLCTATENSVSRALVQITSEPILDMSESVVHAVGLKPINRLIIRLGNVSLERLKLRMWESTFSDDAFDSFASHFPDALTKIAYETEMSHLKGRERTSSRLARRLGLWIIINCTEDEKKELIRESIDQKVELNPYVRQEFLIERLKLKL